MALPFNLPLSRAALARVVPFAAFMLLLALRGALPADGSWGIDPRWVYGITVAVVGGLLAWWWRDYGELSAQLLPNGEFQFGAGWRPGGTSASMSVDASGTITYSLEGSVPEYRTFRLPSLYSGQ